MNFHVLTLFPDMVMNGLSTSVIGKAMEKGSIFVEAVNIRDYTEDRHKKVDDYTYGGGAGLLMQAQPVYDAHRAVTDRLGSSKRVRTIYVTPQGRNFDQRMAMELAGEEELIFLCGHYEGIDERVLEEIVTDYVSLGDFVLTGGELPAMVMIDAISRLVPGVLGNESSAETESFHNDLLEYPQYTRPEIWHGKQVPQVLLSGNHQKIEEWRLSQSIKKTKQVRPDLYEKYLCKQELIAQLSKNKRSYIHMIESLRRGIGEILFAKDGNILIYNRACNTCLICAKNESMADTMLSLVPEETVLMVSSQDFLNGKICQKFGFRIYHECIQACYTRKEQLPVRHKDIRLLTIQDVDYVCHHYTMCDEAYVRGRIEAKAMYGAYLDGKLSGFAGIHDDGSMGMLFVEEAFRKVGLGTALEAYCINRQRELGYTPYAHIVVGNKASGHLQEKLGLYLSKDTIWWLGI